MVLDQSGLAARIPEEHQVFAQQADEPGRLLLAQLLKRRDWVPVAPQQLTGGRPPPDATEQLVLFPGKHGLPLRRLGPRSTCVAHPLTSLKIGAPLELVKRG